jgi:hypothetical protein
MLIRSAGTAPSSPTRRSARGAARRTAVMALSLVGTLAVTGRPIQAQAPSRESAWEFVIPGGMLIPTGSKRDAIQRAGLTAVQLTHVVRPHVAVGATFGWARSRDVGTAARPKVDVFTMDVGGEVRGRRLFADHRVTLMPFAGVGGGIRSYNYRSLDFDATHNHAAYASVGGEVGMGRVRLRVEARNYVTGFEPLDGVGASEIRNDVAVMVGLRFVGR